MAAEELVVVVFALIIGLAIGYFLSKNQRLANKFSKEKREMNAILNDPEVLLSKLNANGKIIDDGKELHYSVVEKDGKKVLELKKTTYVNPNPPKEESLPNPQKAKKNPKKIVKKKGQ